MPSAKSVSIFLQSKGQFISVTSFREHQNTTPVPGQITLMDCHGSHFLHLLGLLRYVFPPGALKPGNSFLLTKRQVVEFPTHFSIVL